jgi:hypothetical protein
VIDDRELSRVLNLLRGSPTFVVRQHMDSRLEVLQVTSVPDDGATYWVSGESQLPAGCVIPSVFVIDRGGGDLVSIYWLIGDRWYKPSDADTLSTLGLARDAVFPFEWRYSVPVENDLFHA